MIKKLVILLIRKKLGLKEREPFQFVNQNESVAGRCYKVHRES